MKKFQVAYIPVGVPTFHLESAGILFEASKELLGELTKEKADGELKAPEQMLLSIDLLKDYLKDLDPDLIVLQNITFANAAYAMEVVHQLKNCPILLWTLREPVIDGGRLRLNSLTGAYSAANTIMAFREEPFTYIFGSLDEEKVAKKIGATIAAAKLKYDMNQMTLTAVGHTPQGFGFGRALDSDMSRTFGVTLESIEARELIDIAKTYSDKDVEDYLADADSRLTGLCETPEKNRVDFAKLYKAYKEYVSSHNVKALASRCWPDFFTAFGTPVCTVLAMLNDLGVAAACEADTYGALSMYMGMQLTGKPAFFGDPVSMDEAGNTITFWHCGTAACSLAREDTGAKVDVHCNRKIGPTLDFGCKAYDRVTIFRVGRDPKYGDFRFFIAGGKALDKPKQFNGTSIVVETDASAETIVYDTVRGGWEPHYAVIYGDVTEELSILADMLDLPAARY